MKSFKDLFIKSDDQEENPGESGSLNFPKRDNLNAGTREPSQNDNPYLNEIIEVYEKGLEGINMPGYDFYDFFLAVKASGSQGDTVYRMAFQMGKTMDNTITKEKLANDAEFYLSKINEVYQKFTSQGREKLGEIDEQQRLERERLSNDSRQFEAEINKHRQEIQALEKKLNDARNVLAKIDEKYKPQSAVIQRKLEANDQAMEMSIQKLNSIKEGILKFL